ncbi:Aspartate 1-decarboxylase [hydrothermal vent metagenome]|uniref:Aspartate 1-decarboxylase n=1 Tax=hydrothermal vent metagenome TaxID=652676 RepID=A0A3B0YFB5_9ZZZZ
MQLTLLKCKLHHAHVTHSELEYEGSCAVDAGLLETAGIREYEQIHIYNLNNGERFTTYAIRAEQGSGVISINGAAAHKAKPGDRVIICTYAKLSEQEAVGFKPMLVYLDADNRVVHQRSAIPVQAGL